MVVGKICNRRVVTAGKESSIREAICLMRDEHVGDVVVVEARNHGQAPVGVLTDRDVVVGLLAQGVDLDAVSVGDVMSDEIEVAEEKDEVADTIKLMRYKGFRRMPVVDEEGTLVGIITLDDIVDLLAEQLRELTGVIPRERSFEKDRRH
ncbi:MAG: CBS domain-containing protein [Gammaproteobacteria bacterium]